jgi:S-adenosyl methyltransferase
VNELVDELEVDPERPSMARIYDYYLGGVHNFAADRQAAAAALAAMPELPTAMRRNRVFLRRAVTVAAEAGVDQFLDLGAGIPAEDGADVHVAARLVHPAARVVYVDLEPVAVLHARRVLGDDPAAGVLLGDLTEAEAVLAHPAVTGTLDLDRPVGLLVAAVAHYIPDVERLGRALERYREALAPGSFLIMSHGSGEPDPHRAGQVRRVYNDTISPMVLRGRDELRAFFGDWPLLPPGITTIANWGPATGDPEAGGFVDGSILVGMARKP